MVVPQIVIDTNVLVAGLQSRNGASFRLLRLIGTNRFDMHLSVALFLEYQDVCKRLGTKIDLTDEELDDFLDYLCAAASLDRIHFLWRPTLLDPKDDLVLELAVAAGAECIVTYNKADFRGIDQFGIELCTAREFLQRIGDLP